MRYNKILQICICGGLVLLIGTAPVFCYGDLINDINTRIKEQESKRLDLEEQAKQYQQIVNEKQGEIKSLNNEVAIFNARIGKLETEIQITEDSIEQTELEILRLSYGIDGAELKIHTQKQHLAAVIQLIAEYDQVDQIELILQSDDFSDFFDQMAYLASLQSDVQQSVDTLQELKEELGNNREDEEAKKEQLEILKERLDGQKAGLASQRWSQERLLNRTRGEEDKYQKLLADIEAQRKSLLGDINQLRVQKAAELARLQKAQEVPPAEYWASPNWFYLQGDPRWAKTTIGMSNSSMENYGCAISSIAMVFTYHGAPITPGELAKKPIYAWDLIYWPKEWQHINLVFKTYRTAADWFRIDRELGAGNPVIVRINAGNTGKGHYVVVHHKTADGRYVVHDPFFGANIYLASSRAYISTLYGMETNVNQMIIYR